MVASHVASTAEMRVADNNDATTTLLLVTIAVPVLGLLAETAYHTLR